MTPHPRNARIKGEPQPPNRFIFGDAVDASGLEATEYLVHTAAPAFVCRLVGNDFTEFAGRDTEAFASALLFDPMPTAVFMCAIADCDCLILSSVARCRRRRACRQSAMKP
jgi:hypothetical protein